MVKQLFKEDKLPDVIDFEKYKYCHGFILIVKTK